MTCTCSVCKFVINEWHVCVCTVCKDTSEEELTNCYRCLCPMHVTCGSITSADEKQGVNVYICPLCLYSKAHKMSESAMAEIDDGMLQDAHLSRASQMLNSQFPDLGGLEAPLYVVAKEPIQMTYKPTVGDAIQIINTGRSHWVTCIIKSGHEHPYVFDSYRALGMTSETETQVAMLMHSEKPAFKIILAECAQQEKGDNCGLNAIAFATEFAFTREISCVNFQEKKLREHWKECLNKGILSPFPRLNTALKGKRKAMKAETITAVYCLCRLPQHYDENMIQCEICDDWVHLKCVGLVCEQSGDCLCPRCHF